MSDLTCTDVDVATCTASGGTPQGVGTTCAGTTCTTPPLPGHVPDNGSRPGSYLTVVKATPAPSLTLAWGASCSPTHADYAIYEGLVATYYSHVSLLCSTGDLLTATITPSVSNRYYLIVPITATEEGSYGLDSFGVERPVAAVGPCRPVQNLACP